MRLAWQGFPFDYEGAHYRIERGGLRFPLDPVPPVYFGGASPAAEQVAALQADTYLLWGEPPAAVASG
ncbi:MAG: alkanesulfonate monooxygenase [bacterium]